MPQLICPGCKSLVYTDKVTPNYRCLPCREGRGVAVPEKEYKLSENDRIMLRVNGILPEV